MTWTVSASGTAYCVSPRAPTFTNGSANIAVPNTASAGDQVVFTTAGTLPTNFTAGTTYYVIATSLSGSNIQVSATPGGSAITAGSAGSGTHTATFENVLKQDATNATYVLDLDAAQINTSMVASGVFSDLLELRLYKQMLQNTDPYRMFWKGTYQFPQLALGKQSPFCASDIGIQATSKLLSVAGSLAVTFSNGSAVITGTQQLVVGDIILLSTTGTLPTNFALLTAYYVISTGLSTSQFELSATAGGSAISAGSAGSGTHTATLIGRPFPWKLLRQ